MWICDALDTNVVSELRKAKSGKADALIAATAIVRGMTIVTRNTEDFSNLHHYSTRGGMAQGVHNLCFLLSPQSIRT